MPNASQRTPESSHFDGDLYVSLPGHSRTGYFAFRLCPGDSGGINMHILED